MKMALFFIGLEDRQLWMVWIKIMLKIVKGIDKGGSEVVTLQRKKVSIKKRFNLPGRMRNEKHNKNH